MTRYFVTAWCDRPYYAQCAVEAETPPEALAKARDAIDDEPAEECNEEYCWERWRVDTADAEGVLLHLDEDAALRVAAPALLHACRMVVDRWERGDLAEAARACQHAIREAIGDRPVETREPIVIEVRGGVVQDVLNVPPGYEYEVKDHDAIERTDAEAVEKPQKTYRVKVLNRTLEFYEVEADSPEEAAELYAIGRYLGIDEESLDNEVVAVEEVRP